MLTLRPCVHSAAQVLLTREKGKNTELRDRLYQDGVEVVEIPLIETERGPDKWVASWRALQRGTSCATDIGLYRTRLQQELAEKTFSWVTITSPEAASVFLDSWNLAGQPDVCTGLRLQLARAISSDCDRPLTAGPNSNSRQGHEQNPSESHAPM